ncbi:extracellular solute-binding protein [Myxococcus sp. CA039A]|uniref:extracellular solute-binding protein n=1 Tax=Myxococcus sp. CA039A TaxID=2741737 RepID=UPI00157A893B|nr:extracellular solute-binding protein [Myxococcus sp. CA039A]NTX52534.1 extracellular solute-binding protein [Myxococcus sp. CA039A]
MKRLLALVLLATAWSAHAAEPQTAPLKLWHAYRGGEEAALLQATTLFTAKTGVRVDMLALPYDAYASKLTNAIPHGAGPDVFIFNHERLRNFQGQNLLAPTTATLVRADYFANTVEALEVDGQVYGYPMSLKSLALYVNTKLVPRPPTTTAELLALLPTLSKPEEGRFGLAYESGDFYFHAPFLFGFDGPLFDATGRASFDTPGMARSLAFVKRLQDERMMPQEVSGALVKTLFNDGRVAMTISGPWFAGEIAPSVQYRVVALPTVSETGTPMKPFLGVEAAFVSSRTEQAARAHELARFLSLGEASRVRTTVGRQIPADVAAYQLQEVKDDTLISSFREAAKDATPMPNTLEMARVWEPMKLTLRAVLQGGTRPEDAGALADRRYRALHRERPPDASPMPWLGLAGVMVLGGGTAWVLRRPAQSQTFRQRYPDVSRAVAYVAPAAAGLLVLVFIPFVVGLSLSLFHHDAGQYTFVGLANFVDILASRGYSITEPLSFYFTLAVTLLWAVVNVVLHVSIGLGLALVLKDPLLKMRGMYRVLLIIPWAVPNYITALMWKGMFHRQFGAINGLLVALGLEPVSWFTRFSTAFAANVATNTWLGFPFMMVVALGALQSIPPELYEAAEVDGASKWTQFRRITLPLLKPAMLPAVILGSVWTFNMFNIIYLVSGGEPGGATDILVSEAFRWAFQRNEQYGFAAAYSVLIFVVLMGWSVFTRRLMKPEEAS